MLHRDDSTIAQRPVCGLGIGPQTLAVVDGLDDVAHSDHRLLRAARRTEPARLCLGEERMQSVWSCQGERGRRRASTHLSQ